jgi:3-dehydroquinate synthase
MRVKIDFEEQKRDSYDIFIDELKELKFDKKVAIITNPKVSGLHLKKLLDKVSAKELYIITVADGERYKNFESLNFILDRLFDHKFDRNSLLIAFGGGVIGDMSGFAASVFQRGIDFIQIPTTLLSQVDASVGGKTGINNSYGKNLIGAFHQPKAVYCETSFLETLPKREFSAGVSEIIKMAVTFDKKFFEWLEANRLEDKDNLKKAIKRSIEIKASVVSRDEKEHGLRSVLNYGHTFAHVIENFTSYSTYLHGEAVAIGINMANKLSVKLSLMDSSDEKRVSRLLQSYALPIDFEIEDPQKFYNAFFLDKKSSNSKIKFILAKGIGDYEIKTDIDKTVLNLLEELKKRG